MNYIKSIELILENCDSISFPANVIGDFNVENISTVIKRIAMNAISKYNVANSIFIEIYKDGDTNYNPFGQLEQESKFKRLSSFNDITSIIITYTDETVDEYYVDYEEKVPESLGSDNINQKTLISEYGNLYIVIDKEKDIKDFVNMDTINNKEHMNWIHDMYSIGIEEEKEHTLSTSSLPALYRYVYLSDDDGNQQLAIRVLDEGHSRFIYENRDGNDKDIYPTKWQYPNKKIDKFLRKEFRDKDFNPYKLKKKYKKA